MIGRKVSTNKKMIGGLVKNHLNRYGASEIDNNSFAHMSLIEGKNKPVEPTPSFHNHLAQANENCGASISNF